MKRAAAFVLVLALLVSAAATAGSAARSAGSGAPTALLKPKPKHKKKKKHAPPPTQFTLTATQAGWHHISPGNSIACAEVTTSPPQAGAALSVVFGMAGGSPGGTAQPTHLLGNGTQVVSFPITQYGSYTFMFTATVNGVTETASITDNVQPSPDLVPPCS